MSEQNLHSNKAKPNVKITSRVYNTRLESYTNTGRVLTAQSKIGVTQSTLSTSYMLMEATERIESRRHTLRLDSKTMCYENLKVTTFLQFFREDWGGVTAIRYLQDGERVAIGFNSGDLQVCNPVEMAHLKVCQSENILKGWEGNDSITCIQFHPEKPNLLYASSTAGFVMRRDLEDPANYNEIFISEVDNEIFCMDFTKNCRLVTVGRDAAVRVYDVTVDTQLCEYGQRFSTGSNNDCANSYHEKRIYCVRCHPNEPSIIISGGWDGVKVWDMRTGSRCVRRIDGLFIFGDAVDICNGVILTASSVPRNSLQLWDLGSGLLINNIDPCNKRAYLYGEYPYVAKFFKGEPSGDLILYGIDGLQLTSVKESAIQWLFEDDKPVIAVDSTDKKIAFGGKSNTVLHGKTLFPDETELYDHSYGSLVRSTSYQSMKIMNVDSNNTKKSPSSINTTKKSPISSSNTIKKSLPSSIDADPIN